MTDRAQMPDDQDVTDTDDLRAVFGDDAGASPRAVPAARRKPEFQPWHHPVKQVVRDHQWAALTARLVETSPPAGGVLRYFTLPGADLFDVRVLADVCHPRGIKIEYFGFDASAGAGNAESLGIESVSSTAGSALLQADRVTPESVILTDRLEDVAIADSQASVQLRRRYPFHVVNIDACDHLAYAPPGRQYTTFDALHRILQHQMEARNPWLLFITTRVNPAVLGTIPVTRFQGAITENLLSAEGEFGPALAAALEVEPARVGAAHLAAWGVHDTRFLRLFCIGLGKFLLRSCHNQPNLPARVELASVYAYRVYSDVPDMLAIAFRITPGERKFFLPGGGDADIRPGPLEPQWAASVASRTLKLQDLDNELRRDADLRRSAFDGMSHLLREANYNVEAWEEWVRRHTRGELTR